MDQSINVIILNWNAPEDTLRCLAQFSEWNHVKAILWVVDNASHDDSIAQIRNHYPHVNLVENKENLGFAGGTNRGISAALDANDHDHLLLNNDASVSEEAVQTMMSLLAANPQIGILGPLLYDHSEPKRLIAAGSRNPVLHIHNLNSALPDSQPAYVNYVSGSVALLRRNVIERIGMLDERYFFTGEVADFCHRAKEAGYHTVVDTESEATHELERSRDLRSTLYSYYLVRNRFLYMRNFYGLGAVPLSIFWGTYGILLAAKLRLGGDKPAATAIWLGTMDGLAGSYGGQNARVLRACQGS